MCNIVVVPYIKENRGCGRAPGHHERGEVGDLQLVNDVNGDEDDESDEGEEEASCDEGEAPSGQVRGEGEDEQHNCSGDVWCYGVEVGLHSGIAEPAYDLRQEELNTLQWHAKADLDGEDGPAGGVLEDFEALF